MMTSTDISRILQKKFQLKWIAWPGIQGNLIVVDRVYEGIDQGRIVKPWWKVWVKSSWVTEKYDCDELAFHSMLEIRKGWKGDSSPAYGVIAGRFVDIGPNGHAMNLYITSDGDVGYFDYQQQRFFEPQKEDVIYWAYV